MRDTRLVLFEGIPGSGKSTTAQFIAQALADQGYPVRWWYEEELGHPVYLFRDLPGLTQVREDLHGGRYRAVIAAALRQWHRFAAQVGAGEEIVVVDGCLFGYLAWSLFPLDVSPAEIMAYIAEVEAIIAPLNPALIAFRQEDIAHSFARVCARRGGNTEARFVSNATESRYGQRHNLRGFAGLVDFWSEYRRLIDTACATSPFPVLTIETDSAEWSSYQRRCLAFLGLTPEATASPVVTNPNWYTGTYHAEQGDTLVDVLIDAADGRLVLDGLPELWLRTPLLPRGEDTFALEGLPFTVTFGSGQDQEASDLRLSGPPLLSGTLPTTFVRNAQKRG
jgi:thymidylate kinase